MREILFVIGSLGIGGAERHLAMVLPELARTGWQISIYSLQGYGPLYDALQAGGVNVILPPLERRGQRSVRMSIFRLATTGIHLFAILLRRRPAIAHFFLPEAYLFGAPLALVASIPKRVMSRRSLNDYQAQRRFYRNIEQVLHRFMTAVLGNSRSVVRQLREERVPERKLGLIYNGIELRPPAAGTSRMATRAALGLANDALLFILVGNLIRYKGHLDLIGALEQVKAKLPSGWRVLLVGRDDGMGEELAARAAQAGISDNILFLGLRNDIPELLEASDVGILCSHQEGFSNAVLEGMGAGLPMIVTDVGGNPEAVLDGVTGLVVPPRDPASLSKAIVKMAVDPGLRRRFGEAGRRRVEEHFTLKTCVQKYDGFYRALLLGHMPRDIPEVHVAEGVLGT
jgi:glycosyltransferase involved in cell wall biosynthesis